MFEEARNAARRIARTREYRQSRCDRKKVEMLFAHLKRILRFDRLRLRGLSGANDEFLLAATAQNLRKLAKLRASGTPAGKGSAKSAARSDFSAGPAESKRREGVLPKVTWIDV